MIQRNLCALSLLGIATLASCETRTLPACVEAPPDAGARIDTAGDPIVLAAGDVLEPSAPEGAEATARLLDRRDGIVAVLGDAVHDVGALDDFLDGYARTWGRHRWRTKPAVGNHDFRTPHAGPYFAYFCAAAGTPFDGWYSYEAGRWHVIVLNSACDDPTRDEACPLGGAQLGWLRADLAAHPSGCTLAYWHHPRFTSAPEGDAVVLRETWQVLHDAGADLVLNGHAHYYERFSPMSADGAPDPERGIQELVVGTGGAQHSRPGAVHANSEVRVVNVWGILELVLHPGAWDYSFVGADGTILDRGSGRCH